MFSCVSTLQTMGHVQGWTGSKKQPWIFSQIGPPQLQTAATISQYYSNPVAFMANNITKPMVILQTKTIETITEILMISTTNTITNITNHQLLTIKTIK